jgi:hypothetical protein
VQEQLLRLRHEVEVLQEQRHPNVVLFHCCNSLLLNRYFFF